MRDIFIHDLVFLVHSSVVDIIIFKYGFYSSLDLKQLASCVEN